MGREKPNQFNSQLVYAATEGEPDENDLVVVDNNEELRFMSPEEVKTILDIDTLENKYVKSLWFEQINSGTSGTITLPTGGRIVLDQWAAGVDALASTISGGTPTFESPRTESGTIITTSMDAGGNYSLSDTPSSYPISIIYCYKASIKDYNENYTIGSVEIIPSAVGVETNISGFNGLLSATDTDVQKALDTIDNITKSTLGLANVTNDAQLKAASNLSDVTSAATAFANIEQGASCENIETLIQYPLPTSGYMLKAAADGSPAIATNTDTEVADAVTKKHANTLDHIQNTDTGTTATSYKINSGGNEADLQTTGLTGDRDYTFPDIDTMLAGSVVTAQNNWEIIAY